MAYLLNGTQIKAPVDCAEDPVENAANQTSLLGRATKDIFNRRRTWTLSYSYLSVTEYGIIKNIYDLEQTVTFEVTETNFTIAQTTVHVELSPKQFRKSGADYRSDVTVKLIEVI